MKSLMESIKSMYAPRTEATMMKDDGKVVHNCAQHVEHASWGQGRCITEEHADPDRYGNIAWYDIEFPHGIEKGVPVSELKILQAESHGHPTKKAKKMAEAMAPKMVTDADGKRKMTQVDVPDADAKAMKDAGQAKTQKVKDQMKSNFNQRMEEEAVDEGVADLAKKVGKAAFKAVTGGSDEDQLKNLQKKMGVAQTGKKPVKEEAVDETVIHADREYDIQERTYSAFFKKKLAAHPKSMKDMNDDEKKMFFKNVDNDYAAKNEDVFLEAYMNSDIQDVVNAHKKAGNRISDEKSATRDGKPHHSFVVTTPEGKRTRHIYHGTTKKLESMSPAKKSKESSEQDLDDK